jgi:pilus assembly protein Flp/PilA
MFATVARLVRNESGATAIEYGLIGALVSVTIVSAVTVLGFPSLYDIFLAVANTLADAL